MAILLIGGDKRFYQKMIPIADNLYDKYLNSKNRRNKNEEKA